MDASDFIVDFLNGRHIAYECHSHKPVSTVEEGMDVAESLGIAPCKCLLLVNRQHQYYMLLIQGDGAVDLRLVAALVQSSRLSFVRPEILAELLHTIPGAVSPLALVFDTEQQIKLLIDEKLLSAEQIMMAPCVTDKSIVMKTWDFIDIFLHAAGHFGYQTLSIEMSGDYI